MALRRIGRYITESFHRRGSSLPRPLARRPSPASLGAAPEQLWHEPKSRRRPPPAPPPSPLRQPPREPQPKPESIRLDGGCGGSRPIRAVTCYRCSKKHRGSMLLYIALILVAARCLLQTGRWFPVAASADEAAAAATTAAPTLEALEEKEELQQQPYHLNHAAMGGWPMAPSIIDARRHRIRSSWPLYWGAHVSKVGWPEVGENGEGMWLWRQRHQQRHRQQRQRWSRVAGIPLRRPQENAASAAADAAASEEPGGLVVSKSESAKLHNNNDNNTITGPRAGSNHLSSAHHHHHHHDPLLFGPLHLNQALLLHNLRLSPVEQPAKGEEDSKLPLAALDHGPSSLLHGKKLKALNNDDDNNDNSLSSSSSSSIELNRIEDNHGNRSYNYNYYYYYFHYNNHKNPDLSVQEGARSQLNGLLGDDDDDDNDDEYSLAGQHEENRDDNSNNNNNTESGYSGNRLLVYGHNNIDGIELERPRKMANKLIASNINDSDLLAGIGKLPQQTEPRFELNRHGPNVHADKINGHPHRQRRHHSRFISPPELGTRSLLRGPKEDGEEVKNHPLPFSGASTSNSTSASSNSEASLEATKSVSEESAAAARWRPSGRQQQTAFALHNKEHDNRIEHELFRVGTRNDVELPDKDIPSTDHYNHHFNKKIHHPAEEKHTVPIDGIPSTSGGYHPLLQPLKLLSFGDGGDWMGEPMEFNRRGAAASSSVATRAATREVGAGDLRGPKAEVGLGGHTFGSANGSITGRPLNWDSDHGQARPQPLILATNAAASADPAPVPVPIDVSHWRSRPDPEGRRRKLRELKRRPERIIGRRQVPEVVAGGEGGGGEGAMGGSAKRRNLVRGRQEFSLRPYNSALGGSSGHLLASAAAAAAQAAASSRSLNGADGGGPGAQRLCPTLCTCLWKNGKHFADCSNRQQHPQQQHQSQKQRNQLPAGFDPLLQVLNYSSNHLVDLPDSAFVNLNLNNLQRIYLSNCQLESIHPRAFHNLKLIVEMDFSWNKLNFVPLPQMKQLTLMRRLTMRGNPLKSLSEATFSGGLTQGQATNSKKPSSEDDSHTLAPDSGSSSHTAGKDESSSGSIEQPADLGDTGDRKWWRRNARRLYETYPELAHTLVQAKRQEQSLQVGDNYIIRTNAAVTAAAGTNSLGRAQIEQILFETLDWLVQQAEQLASSSSYSSSIYLSGPVVGGEFDDDEHTPVDNNIGELLGSNSLQQQLQQYPTLGDHFAHLQELDFGQCKLTYIKWSTLEGLNQLKRLLLDGNQLSQVSGKLVAALPAGLHQISLEENPWKCDCRLLSLKRWLLNTRTPLNAPVRCHSSSVTNLPMLSSTIHHHQRASSHHHNQQQQRHWPRSTKSLARLQKPLSVGAADKKSQTETLDESNLNQMDDRPSSSSGSGSSSSSSRPATKSKSSYLDEMTLDNFVCAPQALESASVDTMMMLGATPVKHAQVPSSKSHSNDADQLAQGGSFQLAALETVFRYLEPTLIRPPEKTDGTEHSSQIATPLDLTTKASALDHLTSGDKQQQQQGQHRKLVQAKEGDRVTLNCSLLAYTESSLDIIWLVDYNHHSTMANGAQQINLHSSSIPSTEIQSSSSSLSSSSLLETYSSQRPPTGRLTTSSNVGRLPAEERFIVLYDSKLHRSNNNTANELGQLPLISPSHEEESSSSSSFSQEFVWNEASLYGSRILIKETRPNRNSRELIFKESQIIIQSAQIDDSARYKCIAINKAGNTSVEYLLRIGHQSQPTNSQRDTSLGATISPLYQHSPTTRDQRAHSANNGAFGLGGGGTSFREAALEAANKARILAAQSFQVTGASTGGTNPSGTWLKSSRTFQITIVVVSFLMAAVILAFLLFCIIIYTIKPAAGIISGPVVATRTEAATTSVNNIIPLHNFGEFQFKPQLV